MAPRLKPQTEQMAKEIDKLDVRNKKMLLACWDIIRKYTAGDMNQVLLSCEKQISRMKAEDFPYLLILEVNHNYPFTAVQKKKLLRLGNMLLKKSENSRYRNNISRIVKSLEDSSSK